jgi:transposase
VQGWLVLGLRPAVENGERGDSTEAYILPKVGLSSVRHDGDGPNAKEATSVEVLIGVDPHKATNVVAAIDEQGELVGQQTFPATRKGLRTLQRWAKRFPERRWAVEGASGIGRPLAQKLLAAGERVVDVPPKLSSRVRVLSTGNARKNDRLDATFTALAALRNDRLSSVQPEDGPEGHVEILRLLTERREDLVSERTRALNRLHVLLRDLLSDPVRKQLSTDAAAKLLRRSRPKHPAGQLRRRLASEVVRDVRTLDRRIAELDQRIATEVKASDTMLTEIFGVGPILAAKILGIVGDVSRFPSKAHFASYAGVAPIEASSGEVVRHRLSLAGNRSLNQVMHMIAVCQARSDPRGRAYHRKKLAEGKSRREAIRCLKRRISDAVFRVLVTDSQVASQTVS